MRGFLIVLTFVLIGISWCSGLIVNTVKVDPEPSAWVTAGSGEPALITVTALNQTDIPLNLTEITFRVEDPEMGTIVPSHSITNATGQATAIFYPGKKSGIASIRIEINNSNPDPGSIMTLYGQRVDHAGPNYILNPLAISSAAVNEDAEITVRFLDRFGNILDDKNKPEIFSVKFDATGSEGYFDGDSNKHAITKDTTVDPVTRYEEAKVKFHLPNLAGQNYLLISVPADQVVYPYSAFMVVEGVGTIPDHIDLMIDDNDPDTPISNQTYADPFHHFNIIYTVRDRFGNSVPDSVLTWTTSNGEGRTYTANYAGIVYLQYSEDYPQYVNITASIWNSGVTRTDRVQFMQPEAMGFALTGLPQMMASRDVKDRFFDYANITVKVFDYFGQPKAGEQVKIYIDYSPEYMENSTILILLPTLNSPTDGTDSELVTTDEHGIATVRFYPGMFPTNKTDPAYDENAYGHVYVWAEWGDSKRVVRMDYKNYPYIKATTAVDTDMCVVGQTINYTLTLLGDGYAQGGPADIVLLENRAGTMLKERSTSAHLNEDRMWGAQNASMVFIGELTDGVDRVAILSYGDKALPVADLKNFAGQYGNKMRDQYYLTGVDNDNIGDLTQYPGNGFVSYTDFATVDKEMTRDHSTLNQTITNITPIDSYNELRNDVDQYSPMCVGDRNTANSLRYGLYKAITYLRHDNEGSKLKVVVGLMDDQWTWFGDPTAQGSLMQKPCGANPGTGPYWPFEDPDKGSGNAMADWHYPEDYHFTGNWDFYDGANNWQNMSRYASDNGIILFMVRYSAHQDAETQRTLDSLTLPTKGQAFYAATPEELIEKFQIIAEMIHTMASVNTSVNIDFNKINVTYADKGEVDYVGEEVFNYTYLDGKSTHIEKINATGIMYNGYPDDRDDTNDWKTNHTFSWQVGNMSIKDNWTVTFMMKVLKAGNIVLFGPDSYINADNPDDDISIQSINLPFTLISCYENWTIPIARPEVIDISAENATYNGSRSGVEISWNLSYTNHTGDRTIKQDVFYQFSPYPEVWTNDWIKFDILTNNASMEEINGTYRSFLDTTYLQGYVRVLIFAYEDVIGGASDSAIAKSDEIIRCERCIQIH
jgi:hypothetical protein